jgi:hypothetical protein
MPSRRRRDESEQSVRIDQSKPGSKGTMLTALLSRCGDFEGKLFDRDAMGVMRMSSSLTRCHRIRFRACRVIRIGFTARLYRTGEVPDRLVEALRKAATTCTRLTGVQHSTCHGVSRGAASSVDAIAVRMTLRRAAPRRSGHAGGAVSTS